MAVTTATRRRGGRARGGWIAAVLALAAAVAVAWLAFPHDKAPPPPPPPPPPAPRPPAKPALNATPTTFAEVFARAGGGDKILLAPGDYGTFTGAVKPGLVTIRPQRGAVARMAVQFARVANVRLEGLTIDGADISGPARAVAIAGSLFTHQVVIHAERMSHAGIVLERNRLPGIDICAKCYEGRVHILGSSGAPSGIVIRGNVLGPGGDSDGIQVSGDGVQIVGNRFVGIHRRSGADAPHTDALQLYGQRNTVIRGNYFHDVATAIMAPDGGSHERIEGNVFDTGGYPFAIMLGGDDGSVIRHNTMAELGGCYDDAPCGTLLISAGPTGRAGRGTVVRDNILGRLSVSGGSALAASDHNLIAVGGGASEDRIGRPDFVGGVRPAAPDGFRLLHGSLGRGAASDGTNVGWAPPGRR